MKTFYMLLLAGSLFGSAVKAQTIHRMDGATSQVLIERDDNGYAGCGVKVVILDPEQFEIYSFSLRAIWRAPYVIVEAKKASISKSKDKKSAPYKVIVPAPNRFWITKETSAQFVKPVRYLESKVPGDMLAALPLNQGFKAIIDIYKGERMQFVLSYPGRGAESDYVISFKAPLSEENEVPLKSCLQAMVEDMQSELERDKPHLK